MIRKKISLIFLLISIVISPIATAQLSQNYPPDDSFKIVTLRTDCQGNDGCFESLTEAANWAFLRSTASNRIMIDVGPGTFEITGQYCNNSGYVTLNGSDITNTIITRPADALGRFVLTFNNCADVTVQNLTIRHLQGGAEIFQIDGVSWTGSGSSNWVNVFIDVQNTGWWEFPSTEHAVHYWFGSRIRVNGDNTYYQTAMYAENGETWFYGGDLEANNNKDVTLNRLNAVTSASDALLHFFGTSIRATNHNTGFSGTDCTGLGMCALLAISGGGIHVHGSTIKVASPNNEQCKAIHSAAGSSVHTPGTAFILDCGDGSINQRISSGSNVNSPFFWGSGTNPPAGLKSVKGQDTFVETDCDTTGCADSSLGSETHMLVYNPACLTSGPWFDIGLSKCRGE